MSRHGRHEGVKFTCDQCDYKAPSKSSLLVHFKSMHEGVKFLCSQCDYQAKWKNMLLRHVKAKHNGVKFPVVNMITKQQRQVIY